jgi:hypothetical protein
VGVRVRDAVTGPRPRQAGPGFASELTIFVLLLLLLVVNGRPVGDSSAGTAAAAWLWRGALALAGAGFELDATGREIVGKLLAAVFAALAGVALFAAVARRHGTNDARWAAVALVGGTTLAAAAQAFSGESAAACAVAFAVWLLARAEAEDAASFVALAGLPLALAVAFQPSTLALALVVAGMSLARRPRAILPFVAWAAPGLVLAVAGLATTISAPGAPLTADPGALALLASPAKGLLFFAPVALVGAVGVVRALLRRDSRFWDQPRASRVLPLACGLSALAHVAAVAWLGGWAEGNFWGPRLLAPAWPLLLLFLPEGLGVLKLAGSLLFLLSLAVQALGAFTYDGRWDKLNRGPRGSLSAAVVWDPARSPLPFQLRERVIRPSIVGVEGRRLVVRQRAIGGDATTASLVSIASGRLHLTGADATMEAVRAEQGARIEGDRLTLSSPGDRLVFRVREVARQRRLEVRIKGSGRGTLGLGEGSFWSPVRWREQAVAGSFRLRLPYQFAGSGGSDLVVALRAGGPLAIESVALVPPHEPEKVIRLP